MPLDTCMTNDQRCFQRNILSRILNIGVVIAIVGLSFAQLRAFVPITIDDAYITFAYAKNILAGNGAVFSPGERIEATSSFLWAILLIPFELVGIGSTTGSKVLGIVLYITSLLVVYKGVMRRVPDAHREEWLIKPGFLAALCVVGTSAFINWTLQGMENPLVAFLLVYSVHLFAKEMEQGQGYWSFLPVFLLEVARPEGIFFCLLFGAYRIIGTLVCRRSLKSFLAPWLLGLALCASLYEIWGFWYYGALLPNTVGAKVHGVAYQQILKGWEYLSSAAGWQVFIGASLTISLVSILCVTNLYLKQRDKRIYVLVLGSLILGMQVCLALLTGGDWMPGCRFLSHLGPLLALTLMVALVQVHDLLRNASSHYSVGSLYRLAVIMLVITYAIHGVRTVSREFPVSVWINTNSEAAINPIISYANTRAQPSDILAASDVGRLGYFFKGRIFDWWGLASPIVVQRGESLGNIKPNTVLEQNPRFVVLYLGAPTLDHPDAFGGFGGMSKAFWDSALFRETYSLAMVTRFTDGRYHALFERN